MTPNESDATTSTEAERARDEQSARLSDIRAQIEEQRMAALAEQPWGATVQVFPVETPTGELTELAAPSAEACEVWGARLAFDLIVTDNDHQFHTVLDLYQMALGGNTDHVATIYSAALRAVAAAIVPQLLGEVEHANLPARVALAEAARNAWGARIGDPQ